MNLKFFSTIFFILNHNGYPLFHRKYNGFGLDINCGNGKTITEIQKEFPYTTFYGIEKEHKKVLQLQKNYPNFNFMVKDIEKDNVRFLYKKFKVIHISDYENLDTILRKTKKLLKNDGVCILRYKDKDINDIHEIIKHSKHLPKEVYIGPSDQYNKIHHFPKNNTLLWFY